MRYWIVLTCWLLAGSVSAQTTPQQRDSMSRLPILYFPNGEVHDFGVVNEGPAADYEFEFVNKGKSPLIIQTCSPSCGCISPSWPKEPILPGKKGIIRISYCTMGRPGWFTKTIVVHSNGISPEGETYINLIVKGRVVAQDNSTTPQKEPTVIKTNN